MLQSKHILVLEDDFLLRKQCCAFLEGHGATVCSAASISECQHLLANNTFDVALIDINLPDGLSLDLLRANAFPATTAVIIMTAEGGVQTAVEAMRLGARDYLSKPFDINELPIVFRRSLKSSSSERISDFNAKSTAKNPRETLFFGQRLKVIDAQIKRIIEAESRLSQHYPPVLIEGETGTGKSSLARYLHAAGSRASQPFVEINCSTLPEALAESELFGHEKGAFTDARKERIGLFEAASGGTLFLDEIASLPPNLQAKVLTAIEDRRIRRVGSNRTIDVDVRLIAASLHPLDSLVSEGAFREDLFHRLNLLHVHIPPIRDFPTDLLALAQHLLDHIKTRYRLPNARFADNFAAQLSSYSWPGNVRELAHEIEKSLIFSSGEPIQLNVLKSPQHPQSANSTPLPDSTSLVNPNFELPAEGFNLENVLNSLTQVLIEKALLLCNQNVSAAAKRLGVSRDFVRYRLSKQSDSTPKT